MFHTRMHHTTSEGAINLSLLTSENQVYIVTLGGEKTEYQGYAITIFHCE
jgi:hypothetical protein